MGVRRSGELCSVLSWSGREESLVATGASRFSLRLSPPGQMFPYLLKQHLQNDRNDTEVAFSSLSSQLFYELQENPNPPLLACQVGWSMVLWKGRILLCCILPWGVCSCREPTKVGVSTIFG